MQILPEGNNLLLWPLVSPQIKVNQIWAHNKKSSNTQGNKSPWIKFNRNNKNWIKVTTFQILLHKVQNIKYQFIKCLRKWRVTFKKNSKRLSKMISYIYTQKHICIFIHIFYIYKTPVCYIKMCYIIYTIYVLYIIIYNEYLYIIYKCVI